jgi:mannose-6-phosphate isomerase-like protein (cupin superfamily)
MRRIRLEDTTGGWFTGNFTPSILKSENFEVCVKRYKSGEREPRHYQLLASEITVIISGTARMGSELLGENDVILLEPLEEYDFEALTDVVLVAVKSPSLPDDKRLSE